MITSLEGLTVAGQAALLRSLLAAAPDLALLATDSEGIIVVWSEGIRRLFGHDPGDVIGTAAASVLPVAEDKEPGPLRAMLDEARASGRWEGPLTGRRKDGTSVSARVTIVPWRDPEGSLLGYTVILREAPGSGRLEGELPRSVRGAPETARPARAALATLSHELRTPLNGIVGFAELLHDGKAGPLSGKQREYVGDILECSRQLRRLLDGALSPSRTGLAAGPEGPERSGAEDANVPGSPGAGAEILVVEDDPGDRVWLTRILTGAGFRVHEARTGQEAVDLCRARAFDGIALDLRLPDRDGWSVLREIRQGTRNARAPVVVVTAAAEEDLTGFAVQDVLRKPVTESQLLRALESAGVGSPGSGPVLLVDDDPGCLKLAEAILRDIGVPVRCCPDGETALEAARRERPSAVVLDLVMPGMSGFQCLDRLRAMPEGRRTPVIVWTAHEDAIPPGTRPGSPVRASLREGERGVERLVSELLDWVPGPGRVGPRREAK